MEKYSVRQKPPIQEKTSDATAASGTSGSPPSNIGVATQLPLCPSCGSEHVERHGGVLKCPYCGTEPWRG